MPPVARRPRGRCGSKRFHHSPGAVRTALPVQERGMGCRAGLAGPPFGDRIRLCRFMQDNVQCSLSCTKSPAHPQSLSAPKPSRCFSQSCPLHASGSFSTLLQSSKSLFMGHTAKVMQALQRTFQTRHSFVMEQEHLPGCPHHESSRLGWGPQLPPAFPSAQSSGFGTRYHQDPFPLLIPTPSLLA